jgi:hypothetical protein
LGHYIKIVISLNAVVGDASLNTNNGVKIFIDERHEIKYRNFIIEFLVRFIRPQFTILTLWRQDVGATNNNIKFFGRAELPNDDVIATQQAML